MYPLKCFALLGLLLFLSVAITPNINAVQVKTNDDRIIVDKQEINERIEDLSDGRKFPLLNDFLILLLDIRIEIALTLWLKSAYFVNEWHGFGYWVITNELLATIAFAYGIQAFIRYIIWGTISLYLGLNWYLP